MRVVSSIFAVVVLAACAIEDAPREYTYPPPVQQITNTPVTLNQAVTATSRDGSFGIHFASGSFAENVSVQINQGNSSPAPAVTLSKSYAVTVTPASATLQQAVEISFVIAPNVVAAAGEANLRVGHGETLGQPWYQALPGTYDSVLGRFAATTSSFSYFLVFDQEGFNTCECDSGPDCQFGCEFCDDDCDAPTCVTDTECESDCCVEGACVPSSYCEEPVSCVEDYECESYCCVDAVCMPASYCEAPVECYEGYDCESECCIEGVCEPSNYCSSPGTCTYDYECETECCLDNMCAPSSYCVDSCVYDYDCSTECCYEGVCSDSSYCVETCSYDYECSTECCVEGMCAPSEMCSVETCVYDYDCSTDCCVEGVCAPSTACATTCSTGALQCSDNWVQECVGGEWSTTGVNSQNCNLQELTCVEYPSDAWATCEAVGCDPATEWQCNDGDCIPAEYRCDRYTEGTDCVDGSDEDPYCPSCSSDLDCPVGETWQCDLGTGTCFQGV